MRAFDNRQARRGLVVYQLVLILIVVIILIIVIVHFARVSHGVGSPGLQSGSAGTVAASPGVFPTLAKKPTPVEITFKGCPPIGDGGDAALNRLKNRVDSAANAVSVPFDSLERLPWPRSVDRKAREHWSRTEAAAVGRYEGLPLVVEGYLAAAKREGPESPNCHGADAGLRDWHIWLTGTPTADRAGAVVIETTPRIRAAHRMWQLSRLTNAARRHQRVRISGWLMLDQEHPEQIGKTRGTLWEIHPITKIEIQQRGRWVALD
ncbi:MAG TPA: hypothetical protein VF166_04155 [Gemmatimonadaceae bacterium]